MRFSILILFLFITIASAQQNPHQWIMCRYFEGAVYWARIEFASSVNENYPVEITGTHLTGRDRIHVQHLIGNFHHITLRVLTRDPIEYFPNLIRVEIGGAAMKRIASNAFENCGNIREIILDHNELAVSAMNGVFRNCQNLRELNLNWNGFTRLTREIFTGLGNLETLNLQRNRLEALPDDVFTDLTNLRTLDLSSNLFQTFSENMLRPLVALENLIATFGILQTFHQNTFSTLANLKSLDLTGNSFQYLPQGGFQNLSSIEVIILYRNSIQSLESSSFGLHRNLTTFYIRSNRLQAIDPRFFAQAPNLYEFNAGGNLCISNRVFNVSSIDFERPNEFTQCIDNWNNRSSGKDKIGGSFLVVFVGLIGVFKMIISIILLPLFITIVLTQQIPPAQFIQCEFNDGDVYWCRITFGNSVTENIPVQITGTHLPGRDQTHVQHLIGIYAPITLNVFTRDSIDHFSNLTRVEIVAGNIERIAANAFENCGNIQEIILNENELAVSAMNGVFRNCQNLRELQLRENRFTRLFREIFTGLGNLETLNLGRNSLETLPDDVFTDLTNLRTLDLSANFFQTFSENMVRPLIALENFISTFGSLRSFHQNTLSSLANLKNLDFTANVFSNFPEGSFQNLSNIEVINLSRNVIQSLESSYFGLHPNLTTFNIQGNRMQAIDPRFFNQAPNLWEFDAFDNSCINERVFNVSSINFERENAFGRCIENWNNRSNGGGKIGGSLLIVSISVLGVFKLL